MSAIDKKGRPYAKLADLKAGDTVELDSGFTCRDAGPVTLEADSTGSLYFPCVHGKHHVDGQVTDGEHCRGIYGPLEAA